jgi:prolyl-tRNA editing enzyme YbaK/EbsC (Cys-tRNA(Pro) deacylase)
MPAQDFNLILNELGLSGRIVQFDHSTRSAQEAADAIGVNLSQIVKSLVFTTKINNKAVVALCSGSNRVDEKKLSEELGEPVTKADADFVRERTGYSIGGVPPFGHSTPVQVFIDQDLASSPEIWAAAGTPNTVFPLTPQELEILSRGILINIKVDR